DEDAVVALAQELVRTPSVYHPATGEGEEAAARVCERHLRAAGLEVTTDEVAPRRPNVVGVLPGHPGGRCLVLEGHTDVVTEGRAADWTYPPFGGTVVGRRLYGRGSADMKGGLAAAIAAAGALARSGVPLGGDLVVGALVDEETGMRGVKQFA